MKLAFSTLGCPNWDLGTIISRAMEYGFDGVDFRGYRGELDIFKLDEFSTFAGESSQRFRDANIKVPCFSSSVRISADSDFDEDKNTAEVKAYGRLCEIFHTPFIRIFGGYFDKTRTEQAVEKTAKRLKKLATIAQDYNVTLLVETHDDWLDSYLLKMLMQQVDSQSVGLLWDTHHPYRFIGEEPAETWQTIGKWIRYTHWKDSYSDESAKEGYRLCPVGDGDMPLREIYAVLKDGNYDGYMTLEWEKMWHPEIEEPEVIFPGFIKFMRQLPAM
ncbi:MAG: TIM barrel protein [Calditrichaeota bacterium]|nr:TIM barrel protein [Calditrichota bacterium]